MESQSPDHCAYAKRTGLILSVVSVLCAWNYDRPLTAWPFDYRFLTALRLSPARLLTSASFPSDTCFFTIFLCSLNLGVHDLISEFHTFLLCSCLCFRSGLAFEEASSWRRNVGLVLKIVFYWVCSKNFRVITSIRSKQNGPLWTRVI